MADVNPIQVQKYLDGMDYPASRKELIEHAKKNNADENVISTLEAIPEQEYETPADVSEAIGDIE